MWDPLCGVAPGKQTPSSCVPSKQSISVRFSSMLAKHNVVNLFMLPARHKHLMMKRFSFLLTEHVTIAEDNAKSGRISNLVTGVTPQKENIQNTGIQSSTVPNINFTHAVKFH